jgi:hypothetical protein
MVNKELAYKIIAEAFLIERNIAKEKYLWATNKNTSEKRRDELEQNIIE